MLSAQEARQKLSEQKQEYLKKLDKENLLKILDFIEEEINLAISKREDHVNLSFTNREGFLTTVTEEDLDCFILPSLKTLGYHIAKSYTESCILLAIYY